MTQKTQVDAQRYDVLWRELWANTHAGGPMARMRYRLALKLLRLSAESSDRMLDVGAGNGAFMAQVLRHAPAMKLYGAEYAQAAIDLAPETIRSRLALCDLQGSSPLPWEGHFQIITCMEVLEHLPDDSLALEHLVDALAPGGLLLITVPAWQYKWGPQDEMAGHVRRYDPSMMRSLLEKAQLKVERIKCWGGPLTSIYMKMGDLIGPQNVMKLNPTGTVGLAAGAIYHILKLDDWLSFGRGEQLLATATKHVS